MRNRKAQGFTLIELLIVIAIIGILAAVLIPNLLNARIQAGERASQAHSQNVYTALNAFIASDITQTVQDVVDLALDCEVEGTVGAGITQYGWNDMPAHADSCAIAAGANGDFQVTVSTANFDYINGERQ